MAKDLEYYLAQARRIAEHREEGAEEAIFKEYKKLLKSLKSYIADVHEKYADGDGKLFFADLQKAGYDARFLEEIEQRIAVATPRAAKVLHQLVADTYELAYKSMVEGVEKVANGADLGETFAEAVAITPEQIKAAVSNPYMENALLKNHQTIVYDIRQAVAVGLMNGDRYNTIAQKITVALDKEEGPYKDAVRIARTEAHRVREAGNNDAAVAVDKELQGGDSGLRMCKTWKTMKDERVRPQRRRKGKKGWSSKMGSGPNHIIMDGQTVLAEEDFDLKDGHKAPAPGSSGIAGHDIHCRCYASFEMMTDAEFYAKTGRHFPGYKGKEEQEPEAKKDTALSRKEMREKIKEDKSLIADAKSRMRAVDRDLDKHYTTDFDDLKGLKKSDITGRMKAIDDRRKEIDPIINRMHNRPERGTPEYEEWREWRRNLVDRDSLIEEQMQLSVEKADLQRQLRKFDRYDEWTKWKQENPLDALQNQRTSLVDEIKRLEAEIKAFEDSLNANPVLNIVDRLEENGVLNRAVKKHAKALAEDEIISALAGGDLTQGSCASLGLAYMGQKGGLNVLDFRDGSSRSFFSNRFNLDEISRLPGAKVTREMARSSTTAGNKLLKHVETGKEYYFVTGRHAAIVRKTEEGTLQYLELQSARYSGWHDFDGNPRYTLKTRFGETSGYDVEAFMIEVDSFKDSDDLKQLLGYINTADEAQRKGRHGTIK